MTVSSPFEGLSDIGSPGGDGPPIMPKDPYAYVVAAFQVPLSPEFVPELVYPKFMPQEEEVFLAKEQPLPAVDPEEDPTNYPTNGGDDDDDDDESSNDDEDDDDDVDEDDDEEEEEEHPTLAQASVPFISEEEDGRFLSIPTPPPSPLTPLSSPLPQIPSPPLPVSLPLPISSPPPLASPTYPLGFRAAMIRLRA
ncbi:hypothetical protein Tco_1554771 [Tanacetum coccineum]